MTDDTTKPDRPLDPRQACDEIDSRLFALDTFGGWGFGRIRQLVAITGLLSDSHLVIDEDIRRSLGEMSADGSSVLQDMISQIEECRKLARQASGKQPLRPRV